MSNNNDVINQVGVTYQRPWGTYKTLEMGDAFQVKRITIEPGGRLSLQRHQQRSEYWVVVHGRPTLTIGENRGIFEENESVFVPVGVKHRMENLTDHSVIIIEVQYGGYLGEDDIERFEDIYGRV